MRSKFALALALWGCNETPGPAAAPAPAGCVSCHGGVSGIEGPHAPPAVGCEACHLGVPSAATAEAAHVGLVRLPGNDADLDRTCGTVGCHPEMPVRLRASIMNTMAGVVAVDRAVFGETRVAETHLRGLCMSCHLGAAKTVAGPVDEASRGGACNACHLNYDAAARADLGRPLFDTPPGTRPTDSAEAPPSRPLFDTPPGTRPTDGAWTHPRLAATPTDEHCFGCHSRSGRISLQAEGLREADLDGPDGPDTAAPTIRTLADGRRLIAAPGDVHTAAGFRCVDCHGSWEVMGDARTVARQADQQTVRCVDCHVPAGAAVATLALDALDPETRRLAERHGAGPGPFVRTGEHAFPNVTLTDGAVRVHLKGAPGQTRIARATTEACRSHKRLACGTCHDAWAPQCPTCHMAWDAAGRHVDLVDGREGPGEWIETPGPTFHDRPTLGADRHASGLAPYGPMREQIVSVAPGMIMTLVGSPGTKPRFIRRFARVAPHTTARAARACVDCHASPLALGYGRGKLTRSPAGRWRFTAELPRSPNDGLPADAWIPLLGAAPTDDQTPELRPLSRDEQLRVLTVGVCLGCHTPESEVMHAALSDFEATEKRRTGRCGAR